MDPIANRDAQIDLATAILRKRDSIVDVLPPELMPLMDEAEELATLVLALHEWRNKGGFDPYAA